MKTGEYTITTTNLGGGDWTATLDQEGRDFPVAIASRGGFGARARAISAVMTHLPEGKTASVQHG